MYSSARGNGAGKVRLTLEPPKSKKTPLSLTHGDWGGGGGGPLGSPRWARTPGGAGVGALNQYV